MRQQLAAMMAGLVALEKEFAGEDVRVYEWRPVGPPELPAVWNWIDDGSYEAVDRANQDDVIVIRTSIGVKPSDLTESMGELMALTDRFRETVDPALAVEAPEYPLNSSVLDAKRVLTRTGIEDFGGNFYVMCMDMLIRCRLRAAVR